MVVAVTPSPSPTTTLAPSLANAYGLMHLQPRQTNYFDYDSGCYNVNAGLKCTSILNGCYDNLLQATDYNRAATSCLCTYGIPYLDCFYSNVATGTCASIYFGAGDYGDYQRSYYMSYCGSIPPSAMAKIQAPATVSLSLETVKVVTATGALQQPNYAGQPNYKGTGDLLQGPCSSTGFTLVDASSTVYYAGFVGCNKDRPECCPWAVASTGTTPAPGAATDAAGANAKDSNSYDFPRPANNDLAQLASCADDYYSISGGCCPNGFWPFTSAVGGLTPCWSSVKRIPPPTLTVEKDGKTMDKPTSAVVNIVWSMRYPVADPGGGGLSTAAKAGIGAGAGVAAILIAGLAFCLWRSKRKNKKLAETQPPAAPVQALPQQQQQQPPFQQPPFQQPPFQQPQMMQHAPVPGGQYPPGAFAAGMAVPGMMAPPSDRASIMTSTTQLSPAALIPQNTGTSGGAVSELSSQSGQGLLHNGQPGGYFNGGAAAAANPRVSYASSSGTGSPAVGGNGQVYPAPIAEADEGQQHYPQYGYQQQQQFPQQQQQPYYAAPGQGQYYQAPPQGTPPPGGYAYPQQHQQPYPHNVPEMSTGREADPPQEVMGSQPQHAPKE